jgi:anti-anti-sigma factor
MTDVNGGDDGALGAVEAVPDPSGALVIKLSGEIDISNADRIGAELERLVGDRTVPLVVDLSDLGFMDSSGIAMLLQTVTRLDSVAVRNPSDVMRRMIDATGLADVLPAED